MWRWRQAERGTDAPARSAWVRHVEGLGAQADGARTGQVVNVPDCYADPRFNPDADTRSGYRTRCLLAVPLVGFDDSLVGVLQLLNKQE